ncbi:alpha/beta hydrolase [Andreprevotia sp. IGB-42]|uniref:alpha/beta hydrolase n=1 Tax=Andreprevotia sp. IGB-42 TaxID=2497473 RepID=UPI00135AD512|nr:alpha/beta hydrolase [Andreprevotia sp. IGB-42]
MMLCWLAGGTLSAPANHARPASPAEDGVRAVTFSGLHGWWLAASRPAGDCALLMHGVRADRTAMLGRARWFQQHGYHALLFDFQAHGESPGEQITFGYRESANAHAAVDFMRNSGQCQRIVAVGQSLGGAAALLGSAPIKVEALVLESVYPAIEDAVADRLEIRLGRPGRWLAPLLYWQIPWRLGIPLDALHPENAIRQLRSPVLIMAGSADRHTHPDEARRLYANAPGPKWFREVAGAQHQDLYRYAPDAYAAQLQSFLGQTLPRP